MKTLLFLAILLYNILGEASRFHSFEEPGVKIFRRRNVHSLWRKNALDRDSSRNEEDQYKKAYDLENVDGDRRESRKMRRDKRVRVTQEDDLMKHIDEDKMASDVHVVRHRSRSERRESIGGGNRRQNEGGNQEGNEQGNGEGNGEKSEGGKPNEKSEGGGGCKAPKERYESCYAGCAAVTCDNPRDRLRPCYPICEPGCVCVDPYVRDDRTHKCVLPQDCSLSLKGIPDLDAASPPAPPLININNKITNID